MESCTSSQLQWMLTLQAALHATDLQGSGQLLKSCAPTFPGVLAALNKLHLHVGNPAPFPADIRIHKVRVLLEPAIMIQMQTLWSQARQQSPPCTGRLQVKQCQMLDAKATYRGTASLKHMPVTT
jgi:hypothetical protein